MYFGANTRVLKISADGTQVLLKCPLHGDVITALAVSKTGTLYVVGANSTLAKALAPNGQTAALGSDFKSPGAIVVDRRGAVFIADSLNGRIVKIQPPL